MILRVMLGILIGGGIGGAMGYFGSCTTGACPLTSNPWIGGLYGAFLGGMIAATF